MRVLEYVLSTALRVSEYACGYYLSSNTFISRVYYAIYHSLVKASKTVVVKKNSTLLIV